MGKNIFPWFTSKKSRRPLGLVQPHGNLILKHTIIVDVCNVM
jgi:hypothetical protein